MKDYIREECNIKESIVSDYLEFSRKISGKCEEKENEFFFGMTFYPDIDKKVNLFIRKNKSKASRIIKDLLLTFLPAKDRKGRSLIEYGFTRED